MKKISAALLSAFALNACSQDVTIEQNGRKAVVEGQKMTLWDERGSKVSFLDNSRSSEFAQQSKEFIEDGTIPLVPFEKQSFWAFSGSKYECKKDYRTATSVFKLGNHYALTFKEGDSVVQKYDGDVAGGKGFLKARDFCFSGKLLDLSQN